MNKECYTEDGCHPEDVIHETRAFIQELNRVQDSYFHKLVVDLGLNKMGYDYLFDFVYNSGDDGFGSFEEYLDNYSKYKYEDLIYDNSEPLEF